MVGNSMLGDFEAARRKQLAEHSKEKEDSHSDSKHNKSHNSAHQRLKEMAAIEFEKQKEFDLIMESVGVEIRNEAERTRRADIICHRLLKPGDHLYDFNNY